MVEIYAVDRGRSVIPGTEERTWPLFHQKERRVKAHVMVAFLGYALWVTLKHLLQRRIEFWRTTGIRGMRRRPKLSDCAAAGAGACPLL
jgi:hypothetical protein